MTKIEKAKIEARKEVLANRAAAEIEFATMIYTPGWIHTVNKV